MNRRTRYENYWCKVERAGDGYTKKYSLGNLHYKLSHCFILKFIGTSNSLI